MASAMTSIASHSIPPFPLPTLPRIRPPPIPKGTPGPQYTPMPISELDDSKRKKHLVWADGRWASPNSNSAKNLRSIVGRKLEKALAEEMAGNAIYAYKNLNTNQVIYSLTRHVEVKKALAQIPFHGKKTVPREWRRDMWRPYFSVHFPMTPVGKMKGMHVFEELKRVALRRQLSPSKEMMTVTQEDLDHQVMMNNYDTLMMETQKDGKGKFVGYGMKSELGGARMIVPHLGSKVPRRSEMWQRRVMDMRGAAVADVAEVLRQWSDSRRLASEGKKLNQELKRLRVEHKKIDQDRGMHLKELFDFKQEVKELEKVGVGHRGVARIEEEERREEERQVAMVAAKKYMVPRDGFVDVSRKVKGRIAAEYEGTVNENTNGARLDMFEEMRKATEREQRVGEEYKSLVVQIENEKLEVKKRIVAETKAEVDAQLQTMSEGERSQVMKELEEERIEKRKYIVEHIAELKAKLQKEMAAVNDMAPEGKLSKPQREAQALRKRRQKIKNERVKKNIKDSQREMTEQFVDWAGPYSVTKNKVESEMREIDEKYTTQLSSLEEAVASARTTDEVEIRWADVRDGTYAQSWPDTVLHSILSPKATVNRAVTKVRQHAFVDDDEQSISEQSQAQTVQLHTSVHEFGGEHTDDVSQRRYKSPQDLQKMMSEQRKQRLEEVASTETYNVRENILVLQEEAEKLRPQFAFAPVDTGLQPNLQNLISSIEVAQDILDRFKPNEINEDDAEELQSYIDYLNSVLPFAEAEVKDSQHTDIDEPRLAWAKIQVHLLELSSKHIDASRQAEMRTEYDAKLQERALKESRVEYLRDDPSRRSEYENATKDLESFDRVQFPFIAQSLARKSEIADRIAQAKGELALRTSKLSEPDAPSELITELTTRINHLKQQIEEDTAALSRVDTETWVDVKRKGGLSAFQYRGADNQESREKAKQSVREKMGMENRSAKEQDIVLPDQGLWGRVKGVFGRR